MKFKPMLLSNDEYDLKQLNFRDFYMSKKRDGVRIELMADGVYNRSLKRIPNINIQNKFKDICDNLSEGFIIEGEIWSPNLPCRIIAGICNSDDKEVPDDLNVYAFDMVDLNNLQTFAVKRTTYLYDFIKDCSNLGNIKFISQLEAESYEDVMKFFDDTIKGGFEGVVLRNKLKPYKCSRVTVKSTFGYKIKPSREDDLEIIGVTERLINTNESMTNELGRSYKRNTKENKASTGIAATFIVKLENGSECGVTITGTEEERKKIWENKEKYIGKIAIVKSMDFGVLNKLRHPRLIRVKEKIEY